MAAATLRRRSMTISPLPRHGGGDGAGNDLVFTQRNGDDGVVFHAGSEAHHRRHRHRLGMRVSAEGPRCHVPVCAGQMVTGEGHIQVGDDGWLGLGGGA